MMEPEITLSKYPRRALRRMRAGMVKTLAVDNAVDNGAPTVRLDFEDGTMPCIDFKMSPLLSLKLFDLLMQPFNDFWSNSAAEDMPAVPADRQAVECGPIEKLALIVDPTTGIPTFTVEFARGASIPAVEFSLSPSKTVTLMSAIMTSAQGFGWIDAVDSLPTAGATKH